MLSNVVKNNITKIIKYGELVANVNTMDVIYTSKLNRKSD